MTSRLNPYLSFRDNAREALTFYQEVFGGELDLNTFGQYGDQDAPEANLVMHGQLTTADGDVLMGSDTPPGMDYQPTAGVSLSLSGADDKLRDWFVRLSEGGTVTMPLEKQMWGDEFGMVTDRFGIPWMVNVTASEG